MKEVTKEQFKEAYFRLGHGSDGWTQDYWETFFENEPREPMKYKVEEPETAEHCRMMIVSDFKSKEYRLFCLTEEAEDSFFGD